MQAAWPAAGSPPGWILPSEPQWWQQDQKYQRSLQVVAGKWQHVLQEPQQVGKWQQVPQQAGKWQQVQQVGKGLQEPQQVAKWQQVQQASQQAWPEREQLGPG